MSFEWSESTNDSGGTLKVELDDSSLRYVNAWFIDKGTQISATVTPNNWGDEGQKPLKTGAMWVDEVHLTLRPLSVYILATAIPPEMLKGQKMHKGTEG